MSSQPEGQSQDGSFPTDTTSADAASPDTASTDALQDYRAPVTGEAAARRHAASLAAVTAPGAAAPNASPHNRLAAAVRRIITASVAAELDDDMVDAAASTIEEVARTLDAASAKHGRRPRNRPTAGQDPQEFFPTSPVIGFANPLAPPVLISVVDGVDGGMREIRGHANFDYPYEGPPTCVHGGVIAETFDEMLGAANIAADNPGMTGTLTVKYRRPTPLRTDLRIEARCLGRTGRKIKTWGGIYHGDVLTAEAEGIFIEVHPEQFLAIAEGNIGAADPAVVEAIRVEAERMAEGR